MTTAAMDYYPLQSRWQRLKHFYRSQEARELWFPSMEAYGAHHIYKWDFREQERYKLPCDYDRCDWRWGRRGRRPHFHDFICSGACHWLASLSLWAAYTADPWRDWRIVSSELHSTVWDGDKTIFDTNFIGLEVPVEECWAMAGQQASTEILEPGEYWTH